MPPRYAYWTILIDQKPTAFRARDKDELLPTLGQLRRKNHDVVMKWFANGRLWDSPDQAEWARKNVTGVSQPTRDRDWRPGGAHRDPRDRFRSRSKHAAVVGRAPAGRESGSGEPPTHESRQREAPKFPSKSRSDRSPSKKSAPEPAWKRSRPARAGQRHETAGRRPHARSDRKPKG